MNQHHDPGDLHSEDEYLEIYFALCFFRTFCRRDFSYFECYLAH